MDGRNVVSEFHRERVFLAVAVVDAKQLEQVLLVARQIDTNRPSFSVNRQRVGTMELCHKTLRTILVVVQVNEVSDGEHVFRSEGIGFAVPSGLENGHRFLVSFLSDTLVGIKSSFDAADAVKTSLLVIVELKPNSVICFRKQLNLRMHSRTVWWII